MDGTTSSLVRDQLLKVSLQSVANFLSHFANKQTNVGCHTAALGGGNNAGCRDGNGSMLRIYSRKIQENTGVMEGRAAGGEHKSAGKTTPLFSVGAPL